LPLVNEPWFELPIVTEWTLTDETIKATCIERIRVDVRDLPSVLGSSPDIIMAMNEYERWAQEQQEQAQREAENRAHK
jgi:hypothetical protein